MSNRILPLLLLTGCFLFDSCSYAQPKPADRAEQAARFARAQMLLSTYRLHEAESVLQDMTRTEPDNPEANLMLALISARLYERPRQALAYTERAYHGAPDAPEVLAAHGRALAAAGYARKAVEVLQPATRQFPFDTALWDALGLAYLTTGDTAAAITAFDSLAVRDPWYPLNPERLHHLLVRQARYPDAYRVWRRSHIVMTAVRLDSAFIRLDETYRDLVTDDRDPVSFVRRGRFYARTGYFQDAVVEYDRALLRAATSDSLLQLRAETESLDRFCRAATDYFSNVYRQYYRTAGVPDELDLGPLFRLLAPVFRGMEIPATVHPDDRITSDLIHRLAERYHVLFFLRPGDTGLEAHLSYVLGAFRHRASHWGREGYLRAVILREPLAGGALGWLLEGKAGIGGWAPPNGTDYFAYVSQVASAMSRSYLTLTDPALRRRSHELAGYLDPGHVQDDVRAVYYSPLLAEALLESAFDEMIRSEPARGDDLRLHLIRSEFQLVLEHEAQHILDNGFDIYQNGGNDEDRTKLAEMVYGENALLSVYGFITPITGQQGSDHGEAQFRVLSRMIDYILNHPDEFPGIDPHRNILGQLPGLTSADIQRIGRAIFETYYPVAYVPHSHK